MESDEEDDGEDEGQEGAEVVADPGDGLGEDDEDGAVADVELRSAQEGRPGPGSVGQNMNITKYD